MKHTDRCAAHGTPTAVLIEMLIDGKVQTVPVCAQCLESHDDARLYVISLRLIVGGVWTRKETTHEPC